MLNDLKTTLRRVALAAIALSAFPAIVAAELVGNNFADATLYTIDPVTGAASNPRATGLTQLTGLTTRPGDNVTFGLTNNGNLYRINTATGGTTLVGPTGFSFIEGDVAYDAATEFLYGIQEFSNASNRLIRIDPATAAGTVIGPAAGVVDVSAGAFSPDGTLYALDTGTAGNSVLLTLSKLTGAVVGSTIMNVNLGTTAGLTFDPATGVAYVADGDSTNVGGFNLYTLSTATGTLTTVGPTGPAGGFAGLTFTPVPEPAAVGTIAAALVLAARRKRRGSAC